MAVALSAGILSCKQANGSPDADDAAQADSSSLQGTYQTSGDDLSASSKTEEAGAKAVSSYAGRYLDEEGTDCDLIIEPDDKGGYKISISIYRLTTIDDGYGKPAEDGIAFTATDPSGQPLKGTITFSEDTATVTFTDISWDYINNGDKFRYFRK